MDVSVLLESLSNIGRFVLYIGLPEATCTPEVRLTDTCLDCCVKVGKDSETVIRDLHIELGCEVDWSSCVQQIVDQRYLEVNMRMRQKYCLPSTSLKNEPFDPVQTLFCRCCDAVLTTGQAFRKILPLPSEHWLELSDLWYCHKEDEFQQFSLGEIFPKALVCLVGETYLLINSADLRSNSIDFSPEATYQLVQKLKESNSIKGWHQVMCCRCLCPLGMAALRCEVRTMPDKKDFLCVKLYKYRISTVQCNQTVSSGPFRNETVETKCAKEISALVEARACHRLFVQGYLNNQVHVLLMILNQNSLVKTKQDEEGNPKALAPMLKVIFFDCIRSVKEEAEKTIQLWQSKFAVETITFSDEECYEVLNKLNHINTFLPPSRRYFNGFKIGFLAKTIL